MALGRVVVAFPQAGQTAPPGPTAILRGKGLVNALGAFNDGNAVAGQSGEVTFAKNLHMKVDLDWRRGVGDVSTNGAAWVSKNFAFHTFLQWNGVQANINGNITTWLDVKDQNGNHLAMVAPGNGYTQAVVAAGVVGDLVEVNAMSDVNPQAFNGWGEVEVMAEAK